MYICILDDKGQVVHHKNHPCSPEALLEAIAPYRDGIVIGVECVFCWYWMADLCRAEGLDFILGHALYMRAIYGVKTKNDGHPFAEDRPADPWRELPAGLCISAGDASDPGSDAASDSLRP